MADLKWQDPPPDGRSGGEGKWAATAAQLRSKPGKWALVHVGSASVMTNIKRGDLGIGPGFEATSRKRDDGRFDVYARFVGEQ